MIDWPPMHARTNQDFAEAVGTSISYASYLRAGKRLPGIALLSRIIETYGLPTGPTLEAYSQGQAVFGAFLRAAVFRERRTPAKT
jgi:transcriptional regulator with XRE-family HTH domain